MEFKGLNPLQVGSYHLIDNDQLQPHDHMEGHDFARCFPLMTLVMASAKDFRFAFVS